MWRINEVSNKGPRTGQPQITNSNVIESLFINEDIKGEAYTEFIEFVWKKCNRFSFTLFHRDLTLEGSFNRYIERHSKTDFDYKEDIDKSKSYQKYYKNVSGVIEQIDNQSIIRRYYDVQYGGGMLYPPVEIFAVKLNRKNAEILKLAPSVFSWMPLDFPENLCMYSDKGCYFLSIAHERMMYIFDTSEATKAFLDSISVRYVQKDFSAELYNRIKLKI